MNKRIIYMVTYPGHLHNAVVSIRSLRRYWDGEIHLYTWSESYEVGKRIAEDDRLGITCHLREPLWKRGGTRAQSEDKQLLIQSLDCDLALYLDADTLICGSLEKLFLSAYTVGFCATQFNRWTTARRTPRKRIEGLRQFSEIDQTLVDSLLGRDWPSINTGVFACKPSSPVLDLWYRYTVAARAMFIADETAFQPMLPRFIPTEEMWVETGGHFNSSAKFQDPNLKDEDVVVWHFHGGCNVRPKKSPKGVELWLPEYDECVKDNVGGIRDWASDVNNRHLRNLLKELGR